MHELQATESWVGPENKANHTHNKGVVSSTMQYGTVQRSGYHKASITSNQQSNT